MLGVVAITLPSPASERRQGWWVAIVAGLASWVVLAWTAPHMPMVWDEGDYLFRADLVVAWFRLLFDVGNPHGGLHALASAAVFEHWQFIYSPEGHPAWFAIPIALSKAVLTGPLDPLTAARLGPITVFSIAAGAVALRLKRDYGATAALVAPIALLTLPRIFSHAHFATLDGQLTAWWLLLWAADSSARRGPRTALGVGVLLGLTCATKFTGWLAVVPVVLSRAVTRDAEQRRELLVLLPIALLTFCAVNPPLWHAPLAGLVEHFRLSLGRSDDWNLPISFLGRSYDMHHPLPWYNTIAWLILVTPVPTLVLGLIGLRDGVGKRAAVLILHWATLMIIRALPGAPPHDGVRLFLPALGFWCVFAGLGAQRVWEAASSLQRPWHGTLVRSGLAAALAATAINLARYYPQTLSHYSLLVGGVRGAASVGMEPTYWWDALDDDVLHWLNSHTQPGAAVAFSEISDYNVALLRDWGRLRTEVADRRLGTFQWYVLQNRSGLLSAAERTLIHSETPAYVKYAGRHPSGVPADLKVPLILVFSYDQYWRAVLSTGLS